MKRILIFLLTVVLGFHYGNAQNIGIAEVKNGFGSSIPVVNDTINLGEIYLDDLAEEHGKIDIKLTNADSKPLLLRSVKGCCGTNIKAWPKAPVLPNKQTEIRVEFRIEPKPQRISRTVTIESNAKGKPVVKYHIVGLVMNRKASNEIEL
ncbi:DUF1573 domain-containing protein [Tenuifilum thalassicum]|uniref:DUF1573 domain-containing protein n=1 Tax=Tenuifilum thalassicum TaxID=2590900 RepID=A0A7D4BBM2_9BACT|nr:DUF1573 domain-containing protein [Tenuifilum thalassicum]QKG80100.1 DUF1573 domain-containing protein [Tenuifilum thalassicum]